MTKLMRSMRAALVAALLLALVPLSAQAQTALTSTTLSAALTNANDQVMTIASATGWTSSTSSQTNFAVIDREVVGIRTVSGTQVTITRGLSPGLRATGHVSGATVYFIPGGTVALSSTDRSGACSTGGSADLGLSAALLPVINPVNGSFFQCSAGAWLRQDITDSYLLKATGTAAASAASPSAGGAALTAVGGVGGAQSATTGNGAAGGAPTVTGGVGGAGGSSSGTGGTGGAVATIGGAGGGTVTGGTGGAASLGGGAGGAGTSAGGTGGVLNLYSGAAGSGGTGTVGAVTVRSGGAGGTAALTVSTAGKTTVASTVSGQNIEITPAGTGLTAITNNGVALTLPTAVGSLPRVIGCGATSGNANCANTNTGGTARIYMGDATLSSNAAVITFGEAFTSTSTYTCVANDVTTRANPVQMVSTSSTTATITNTTGASDVIRWTCVGY